MPAWNNCHYWWERIYWEKAHCCFSTRTYANHVYCVGWGEPDLDKVLAPKIKFEIKIEDVTIGHTDDFVTAFAMLLSTDHFSYILCWKLQASLHLIQKLFVEIADGVKVPHKVLNELYLDVKCHFLHRCFSPVMLVQINFLVSQYVGHWLQWVLMKAWGC